ncbi:MAG: hypothetical protein AAB065_05120, partial [Deltaproteobacteria bacterium]
KIKELYEDIIENSAASSPVENEIGREGLKQRLGARHGFDFFGSDSRAVGAVRPSLPSAFMGGKRAGVFFVKPLVNPGSDEGEITEAFVGGNFFKGFDLPRVQPQGDELLPGSGEFHLDGFKFIQELRNAVGVPEFALLLQGTKLGDASFHDLLSPFIESSFSFGHRAGRDDPRFVLTKIFEYDRHVSSASGLAEGVVSILPAFQDQEMTPEADFFDLAGFNAVSGDMQDGIIVPFDMADSQISTSKVNIKRNTKDVKDYASPASSPVVYGVRYVFRVKNREHDLHVALATNEEPIPGYKDAYRLNNVALFHITRPRLLRESISGRMSGNALPRLLSSEGAAFIGGLAYVPESGRKDMARSLDLDNTGVLRNKLGPYPFYITREYRGLGLGTIVMAQAIQGMKAAGIKIYFYPEGTERVRGIINSLAAVAQGIVGSVGEWHRIKRDLEIMGEEERIDVFLRELLREDWDIGNLNQEKTGRLVLSLLNEYHYDLLFASSPVDSKDASRRGIGRMADGWKRLIANRLQAAAAASLIILGL